MTIRLAFNPIVLSAGDIIVRLRPSLRAGALMAQSYSIDELEDKIGECHLGTISYLIAIGCDDIDKASQLLAAKTERNGLCRLEDFYPALIEFIQLSFGLSDRRGDDAPSAGKPVSFIEAFTELYEFATGWLQWSSADAWAATPAEIVHARKGHIAMLRAIHGSGEEEPTKDEYTAERLKQVENLGYDPAFDQNEFAALRQQFGEGF